MCVYERSYHAMAFCLSVFPSTPIFLLSRSHAIIQIITTTRRDLHNFFCSTIIFIWIIFFASALFSSPRNLRTYVEHITLLEVVGSDESKMWVCVRIKLIDVMIKITRATECVRCWMFVVVGVAFCWLVVVLRASMSVFFLFRNVPSFSIFSPFFRLNNGGSDDGTHLYILYRLINTWKTNNFSFAQIKPFRSER